MAEPEKEAKLKFRYIAAYVVDGLQSPGDSPLLLYSDAEQGRKIFLTSHTHEGLHHIDTVHTIANMILNGMFRGEIHDFGEVGNRLAAAHQDRIRRYGANVTFLVVEASHEEDAASIGQIGQSDDRDFCLAIKNGFKDEIETKHKLFLDQSQAFLAFAMPSVSGFERVGSCVVADHPSGKPLYVLTPSGSARLSVLSPIPADGPERYATLFQHSAELDEFRTAFRLSAGSALNARDNLRSFVFAFAALESFLSKFFSQHKRRLSTKENLSPAIQTYVKGIEERREKEGRTKDDYPPAYKFALVASFLALDNLDETVNEFDRATRDRNAIAHGQEFDEAALPIAKVRKWLGELVRLHVARPDPQCESAPKPIPSG